MTPGDLGEPTKTRHAMPVHPQIVIMAIIGRPQHRKRRLSCAEHSEEKARASAMRP